MQCCCAKHISLRASAWFAACATCKRGCVQGDLCCTGSLPQCAGGNNLSCEDCCCEATCGTEVCSPLINYIIIQLLVCTPCALLPACAVIWQHLCAAVQCWEATKTGCGSKCAVTGDMCIHDDSVHCTLCSPAGLALLCARCVRRPQRCWLLQRRRVLRRPLRPTFPARLQRSNT